MTFICSLILSAVTVTNISFAQGKQARFSITISSSRATIAAGSDMRVDITLRNISDHPIPVSKVISDDEAELDYEITVRNAHNNEPGETKWGRRLHGKEGIPAGANASRSSGLLKPGDTLRESATLSKIYDVTAPGHYRIRAQKRDPESGNVVKSNILTVTVTKPPA